MQRDDPRNHPTDTPPRPWLRLFTALTILATFSLIAIGGHVTSNDVGLAVPDGFTTFGHFTLTAPIQKWWYEFGTRWEHSHRLKGMVVGMMTIAMAVWLWKTQRERRWLRWSGLVMLGLVISQGVMGALRVSEISLTLAFVHGIVGQCILCAWVVIAAALGRPWLGRVGSIAKRRLQTPTPRLRWAVRALLVLLLVQLTLGSAVRHFKADKAVPDFPLIYGQALPPFSQDELDRRYSAYYTQQAEQMGAATDPAKPITNRTLDGDPIVTLGDVDLQMGHRLGAVVVCVAGLWIIIGVLRRHGPRGLAAPPALTLGVLLTAQFALGVITVMTGTDPLMATLHQATGAALIAVATWLAVRIHLAEYAAAGTNADSASAGTTPADPPPAAPAPDPTPRPATASA